MRHDARAVANALIERSFAEGQPLTPLQVIKLVYFCHAWMLGLHGRPLINEPIEAWEYGPVIETVYQGLKHYRGNPVKSLIDVPEASFDDEERDIIRQVYAKYGSLNGFRLSALTHAPSTPWQKTWEDKGKNSIIPNSLIQEHYSERAASQ